MNASLNEMLRTVKWGKHRLDTLFVNFNGNFDIQKEHINGRGTLVITAGLSNNGILGKTDIDAKIFPAGTLTVDMFGNVFYRNEKYKMVTHARVFSLCPKFDITDNQGLFLSSTLSFLHFQFGFDSMCTWDKIKSLYIDLPTCKSGTIDFEFMESFIAELEAERVSELSAYLKASELVYYELSTERLRITVLISGVLLILKLYTENRPVENA